MEEVLKELEQLKGYALLSAKEMLTIFDKQYPNAGITDVKKN